MKKKLLITSESFLPRYDGVSRFITELVPYLTDEFDITILAPDYRKIYKKEKLPKISKVKLELVQVSSLKLWEYNPARLKPFKIIRLIRENDIVFVNGCGTLGSAAIMLAKLLGKPILNFVHVIDWELIPKYVPSKWLKKPLYFMSSIYAKIFYNLSDLLILSSEEIAEKLSLKRIIAPKTIINLGVGTKKFKPARNKQAHKKKYNLEDYFIIGYCGRLSKEKDPETILKAFRLLYPKYKDMRLLVIGEGLKEIEEKFKRNPNVIYLGRKNNVEEYYKLMDVFHFTSLTETTGLVLLEAMASGVPVISTKVGIADSVIINGKTGFLIDKRDYLTLAKLTEKLYKDRVLREEIGKKTREIIIENFNFEDSARRIKEVITKFSE